MLLAHRVVGRAHVEQHTAILQHRGCRMVRQILFDALGRAVAAEAALSSAAIAQPLPALPRAQAGDVRRVVARVPVVNGQRLGQVLPALQDGRSPCGNPLPSCDSSSATQRPCSAAINDSETPRAAAAVGQLGPGGLIVGLDGRPILGERQLEADVGSWRGCRPRDAPPGAPSSRRRGRACRAGRRSSPLPPRADARAASAAFEYARRESRQLLGRRAEAANWEIGGLQSFMAEPYHEFAQGCQQLTCPSSCPLVEMNLRPRAARPRRSCCCGAGFSSRRDGGDDGGGGDGGFRAANTGLANTIKSRAASENLLHGTNVARWLALPEDARNDPASREETGACAETPPHRKFQRKLELR